MEHHQQKLAEFGKAIAQNPEDVRAIAHRGEAYRLMKHYEDALADFDKAIELNSEYNWAIAHRGEVYYQREQYQKALADFDRALQFQPDYPWAIAHRGVTYERIELYQQALNDLNRAIKLNPTYAWAIAYRFRVHEMMRQYEKALIDFDRAISLDESIIEDWVTERGLLLSFLRRYPEAMEYYKRALEEKPNNHLTLYCIAFTKTRWKGLSNTQADIDKARSVLNYHLNIKVNSDAKKRSALLYELGGLAALESQSDQALKYLQESISLDYIPKRRALHDLAWLELYSDQRFQALIVENLINNY
jgi:tetratricopeptide (TPR) repeat protein